VIVQDSVQDGFNYLSFVFVSKLSPEPSSLRTFEVPIHTMIACFGCMHVIFQVRAFRKTELYQHPEKK